MEWISIEDRLPTESKEYLVSRYKCVNIAIFSLNYKFYNQEKGNYYGPAWENNELGGTYEDVNHWMPLPNPPKVI